MVLSIQAAFFISVCFMDCDNKQGIWSRLHLNFKTEQLILCCTFLMARPGMGVLQVLNIADN